MRWAYLPSTPAFFQMRLDELDWHGKYYKIFLPEVKCHHHQINDPFRKFKIIYCVIYGTCEECSMRLFITWIALDLCGSVFIFHFEWESNPFFIQYIWSRFRVNWCVHNHNLFYLLLFTTILKKMNEYKNWMTPNVLIVFPVELC